MMFDELNASGFTHNSSFYNAEFEEVLSKIILCYNIMVKDNVSLINDENKIRDVLLIKYLKDNSIRKKIELTNYLFDREVPEDISIGRTDIKVQTLNTFKDTSAYYILECKRINASNVSGTTGLNAKYIKNGICRFISETYSTYNKTNGMLGFIVQGIDIHKNIECINLLLNDSFKESSTVHLLKKKEIIPEFDFSYYSLHKSNENEISIYHLMFDFSKNIKI